MSRLITIISILILILGLSLAGIFYARDVKQDFDAMIGQAQQFCAEETQAELLRSADRMQQVWEGREGFLSFYVRHDEIEKMATHLVTLQAYAQSSSFESASVTLDQMSFMVDHIYHRELPNLDNLF